MGSPGSRSLNELKNRTTVNYCLGNAQLSKSREEKDLRVAIEDNLTPGWNINKTTGEVYNLITNIKAAFSLFCFPL